MPKNGSIFSSLQHAIDGLITFLSHERNARFHSAATVIAILLGFWLDISILQWTVVVISISFVWAMELINTSIEKICDQIDPNPNPTIKTIKDLAAGAVLVAALMSVIIGLMIYLPPLIEKIAAVLSYK
jgi:diacylglycerol kinase